MAQTAMLLAELKRALREAGYTYRDLAAHLDVSEPTVKRMFSQANFTLGRLERCLAFVGLDFSELMERVNGRRDFLSELTREQEDALVGDPELFVITFLVLNRWKIEQIVERYNFTEQQVEKTLLMLNRLKLIELLPLNRYRLLTAPQPVFSSSVSRESCSLRSAKRAASRSTPSCISAMLCGDNMPPRNRMRSPSPAKSLA